MINTVRLLVAFTILALLSRTGQAVHWLDMKMPPIEVDGSLFDVAIELHKIPLRVCIEDVNLSSEPGLNHIHLKVKLAE